jgi:uncharacterized C2H2 Zn-finger protein
VVPRGVVDAQRSLSSMPDCPSCHRQFKYNEALIQHTEAAHGKGNVHRGVRMWENSRNQSGELTTGKDSGQYSYEVDNSDYCEESGTWDCSICSREFWTARALEQHLNSGIHEADLYRCQGCQRTFRSLGSLNQHVTMTGCSERAARQVRTLLGDASRQAGLYFRSQMRAGPPAAQRRQKRHSTLTAARLPILVAVVAVFTFLMTEVTRLRARPSASSRTRTSPITRRST